MTYYKYYFLLAFIVLAGLMSPAALSASSNATTPESHVVSLLVHVNAKGEVTDIDPAYKLRSDLKQVVSNVVHKMITKPATNKDGKPMSSQLVLVLALKTQSSENGKANVKVDYISSRPVPIGVWHWVHLPNQRLALRPRIDRQPTEMQTNYQHSRAGALNQRKNSRANAAIDAGRSGH